MAPLYPRGPQLYGPVAARDIQTVQSPLDSLRFRHKTVYTSRSAGLRHPVRTIDTTERLHGTEVL